MTDNAYIILESPSLWEEQEFEKRNLNDPNMTDDEVRAAEAAEAAEFDSLFGPDGRWVHSSLELVEIRSQGVGKIGPGKGEGTVDFAPAHYKNLGEAIEAALRGATAWRILEFASGDFVILTWFPDGSQECYKFTNFETGAPLHFCHEVLGLDIHLPRKDKN